MKKVVLAAAIALTGSFASAGTLVFEEPVESEVIVAEETAMGGSAIRWLIPLLLVGAIVLVAGSGSNGGGGGTPPPPLN